MPRLRHGLICGLLLIACIVGLQISYLVAQAATTLRRAEVELLETSRQAQATLLYSQAVLSSLRGTTEMVRRSAVEQMGYYEAVGRRSALALARLDLLIAHTDERMERITRAAEKTSEQAGRTVEEIGALAATLREDLHILSAASENLVEASTRTVENLDERLSDERLDRIANKLAAASENTAQATANVAEATGYLRDMLSPTKKSFWRWALQLLLPRPTLAVR